MSTSLDKAWAQVNELYADANREIGHISADVEEKAHALLQKAEREIIREVIGPFHTSLAQNSADNFDSKKRNAISSFQHDWNQYGDNVKDIEKGRWVDAAQQKIKDQARKLDSLQ